MKSGHALCMSLMTKLSRFARSPRGRKLTDRAKTYASSPQGKRKIEQARKQLTKPKRRRPH
jgi:hypothetical protein